MLNLHNIDSPENRTNRSKCLDPRSPLAGFVGRWHLPNENPDKQRDTKYRKDCETRKLIPFHFSLVYKQQPLRESTELSS